ncbi:MAG: DinB family protein [Chloroflexota bacterium]
MGLATLISRPAESEYVPFYGGYVQLVPDGDIFGHLTEQIDTLKTLLSPLSAEQANFRFGPDEWSIKEVVGHINDAERIFSYRALRISRNDQTPLPGFDQNNYVREANFGDWTLADLLQEFELLRRANLLAFNRLSPDISLRSGTAGNGMVSVRALLYIMVGHVAHHMESLHTNYLAKL